MVESIMISAFPIFAFMVNGALVDFDFTDAEVSLKIGTIVNRVPKAPFDCAIDFDIFRLVAIIC